MASYLMTKGKERYLKTLKTTFEKTVKNSYEPVFNYFVFQEVSRNPDLSEDDAAMLVAAHIKSKQPKNYGYYRVGAIRNIGGSHKLRPKMDSKLRVVS